VKVRWWRLWCKRSVSLCFVCKFRSQAGTFSSPRSIGQQTRGECVIQLASLGQTICLITSDNDTLSYQVLSYPTKYSLLCLPITHDSETVSESSELTWIVTTVDSSNKCIAWQLVTSSNFHLQQNSFGSRNCENNERSRQPSENRHQNYDYAARYKPMAIVMHFSVGLINGLHAQVKDMNNCRGTGRASRLSGTLFGNTAFIIRRFTSHLNKPQINCKLNELLRRAEAPDTKNIKLFFSLRRLCWRQLLIQSLYTPIVDVQASLGGYAKYSVLPWAYKAISACMYKN
jgi:hypothetical protein